MMRKVLIPLAAAAALIAGSAIAPLAAQNRDPAYADARAKGLVGEQVDGYLGIVGTPTPDLRALVNNINIRRKAAYTESAANSATVEDFAFTSGCNLIAKTAPGEKYQAPDGSWQTRSSAPPKRDPRCV